MGKTNTGKLSAINRAQKIQPIRPELLAYDDSLRLFQAHPSLPTFFLLLDRAIESGVRLSTIEDQLPLLISIPDDQYFGAYGSLYFRRYVDELESAHSYRSAKADLLYTCSMLWQRLERFPRGEIWAYDNILVGVSDYVDLYDQKHTDEPESKAAEETIGDSHGNFFTDKTRKMFIDALVAEEESSRALSNLAKSRGINMVPWAAWVLDYLPARTELKDGLSDLSDYLASYCTRGGDAIGPAGKSDEGSQRLGQIDAKSFARISEFLIFGRLFRKVVYGEEKFPLETFFDERTKYLSSRDALDDPIDQADYIFGISNLLMMIARLDLKSTKEELVSKGELERDFLFDVDAECLDLACISPLPGSGFIQVIEAINPYEGDRPEAYHLDKAFRVADYGLDVPWNSELFFEMYEDAYSGLDPEVSPHLKAIIHRAAKGWIIPLHQCGSIVRIYDDFWSDQLIVEKISDALFRAERSEVCLPLMHTDELKQSNFQCADFESDYHPAIFARKFSNHVDFARFQGQQWFDFCRALIHAEQPRHACTVLALYIIIIGINRLFNIEGERALNVRIVMKLLNELSGYNSFRTVRQSIGDLFEMSPNIPEIYKGSLKEFLPIQKAQVISIKDVVEEDFNKHEERLIGEGHIITRLSKEAKGSLLKGYALARTRNLSQLNLAADAVRNYVLSVEGELRSRVPDIDNELAEELKYMRCDIDWLPRPEKVGRRAVFRGLTSICNMIDHYSQLSPRAQEKLSGFSKLALHKDIDLFRTSLREFIKIRNAVQHADGSGVDPGANLPRVEDLMFGSGALVRILCDSR